MSDGKGGWKKIIDTSSIAKKIVNGGMVRPRTTKKMNSKSRK